MYKIEGKPFGVRLTFADYMDAAEMKKWVEDSRRELLRVRRPFGVFVDMRTLKPLSPDARKLMEEGQKLYKTGGMERSVVILDSPTLVLQFKRVAKDSGIYEWERYLDASKHSNWEQIGIDWLVKKVDPDAK